MATRNMITVHEIFYDKKTTNDYVFIIMFFYMNKVYKKMLRTF